MKDSKEYSQKVRKMYRSWKRKYPKPKAVIYDEPLDALVYATVSENINASTTQAAIKRFSDYFIDLNDLRVSRAEEIVEAMGTDTPVTRNIASMLTRVLRAVFEKYNTVSLVVLTKTGKRPAKQVLEKLDGVSRFAVNYCMLTAFQGHAIPLTERMVESLRKNELVHPEADQQEIEGFLMRQISAENAYDFYTFLRRRSESGRAGTRKKKKTPVSRKPKQPPKHKE